jgi:hypothetical protein
MEEKVSNYNSRLFVDECIICGNTGNQYPLDTHHIQEQNTFDEHDFHKNKLSNIVILCKQHHFDAHNGNLKINGYVDTLQGKKIDYTINNTTEEKINKKKYNENQIHIIQKIYEEFKGQNNYLMKIIIELRKYDITISKTTLTKIILNNY